MSPPHQPYSLGQGPCPSTLKFCPFLSPDDGMTGGRGGFPVAGGFREPHVWHPSVSRAGPARSSLL